MGLDSVELVLDVEERFQITITDDAAGKIRTPANLIDLVFELVPHGAPAVCLTQRAFYRVRRALKDVYGVPRKLVRPAYALERVIPRAGRAKDWPKLMNALGVKRVGVSLSRSDLTRSVIVGASLLTTAGTYALLPELSAWWFVLVLLATASGLVIGTQSLRVEFPKDVQTIGQLAEFVSLFVRDQGDSAGSGFSRSQVRDIVRGIISQSLNLSDFDDNDDFVEDLGLD